MLFGLTPEQEELQRCARMVADKEFRLRARGKACYAPLRNKLVQPGQR